MSKKGRIAFILEGEKREKQYFDSLSNTFFQKNDIDCFFLSAKSNLYMVWKQLKNDQFETDLLELLRESDSVISNQLASLTRNDFQEIYLFFDMDPHQNNLSTSKSTEMRQVLQEMLEYFNNETTNGKLYISYPMVEALRDISSDSCAAGSSCWITLEEIKNYKQLSACNCRFVAKHGFNEKDWELLIAIFLVRIECLFCKEISENQLLHWFKLEISPSEILSKELLSFENEKKIFVLSALPEFLLDYFKAEKWEDLNKSLRIIQSAREYCSVPLLNTNNQKE